ncbi:MAG: sigma-70 family RNA polymerase sigma factor [Pseudonocardiales bacterium]|nr:sigma-70 family RNA polymerase sigma factor [Pseudonocardiales bacterium]
MQYLRYAFRKLRNSPIFTVTSILTLTLGIGATTAIFSIVYGVLLKALEYPQPEQLVNIQECIQAPGTGFPVLPVNANHFLYWRKHNHSFSGLAALLPESMPLGGGQPEEIGVARETANTRSAESLAMLTTEHQAVVVALGQLPPRQREVLVLRYYGGMSEAEIAAATGVSRGTVKSSSSRALDALQRILEHS